MMLGIIKRINGNKGVTLTELIVSVSILAVVVTPFLGSFTAATRTNVLTETKLEASSLAQKAMEEIKAKMNLATAAGAADVLAPVEYQPSDSSYSIYYSVDDISLSTWKTLNVGSDILDGNSTVVQNSNLKFKIGSFAPSDSNNKVEFLGTNTVQRNDGFDSKYILTLSKSGAVYNYQFGLMTEPVSVFDSSAFTPGTGDISVMIQFADSFPDNIGSFKLYLKNNVDISDKPVRVYVVDNKGNYLSLVNEGDYEFYQYAVSTAPVYNNTLFRITVVVRKNGTEAYRLVSYIKK